VLSYQAVGVQLGIPNRSGKSAASVMIPSDDRSVLATAYEWAARIIVVSLEMVLPGLAGYWIDTRLGTVCLFLVLGLTVGSIFGVKHLITLAGESSKKRNNRQ
jgi:hypothetical protein